MRDPAFRRTLMELVMLAAPMTSLLGCGGGHSPPDASSEGQIFDPCPNSNTVVRQEPEPPSAALLDLVRACEADVRQCDALCQQVLYGEPIANATLHSCAVEHTPTGHTITVGYCWVGAEGRRPHGLASARRRCPDATGAHLARAAFYEAASIHAFVQLARELSHYRAPLRLVHAVRRAAVDEIGHARLMAGLARARGAAPPPLVVTTPRRRSLEAIAIENAREGVVGETWSAMIALWQSRHAPSAALRASYDQIATDELRHAEVALEIAAWTRARLSPAARCRVQQERDRALAGLARSVRRSPPAAIVRELGVPDRATTQRLYSSARARLWT